MLLQLSHSAPSTWYPPFPPAIPPHNSCPWVIEISYLVSPFPILYFTFPYFLPTNLYFLIPAPLSPFSLFPLPSHNPPRDLHICNSVSIPLLLSLFS